MEYFQNNKYIYVLSVCARTPPAPFERDSLYIRPLSVSVHVLCVLQWYSSVPCPHSRRHTSTSAGVKRYAPVSTVVPWCTVPLV